MKQDLLPATFFCLVLAVFLSAISANLYFRYLNRAETIQHQFAILEGRPFTFSGQPASMDMWRNRVFFPLLLKAAIQLPLFNLNQWYLLLRLLCAFGMLLAFGWVLRTTTPATLGDMISGLSLLAYMLVFTFLTNGWEIPSDFPDAGFTALFLRSALTKRRIALVLLTLLASANRESSAFAGVIWLCLHGVGAVRLNWREVAFAAALCLIGYGVALGLRHGLGAGHAMTSQAYALSFVMNPLRQFVSQPAPFAWPVCGAAMILAPLALICQRRRQLGSVEKSLLCATGLIGLITLLFGVINELRVFIPSAVILAYVATSLQTRRAVAAQGFQVA